METSVALVAAVARNGTIGANGDLPWHLPADLQHFRKLTLGAPVLMGRKTWESLPARFRPLPGRRNLVLSRDPAWQAAGAERVGSVSEAIALVRQSLGEPIERLFVIGGAQLYAAALPIAHELFLTEIDALVDGDAFFPPWDRDAFEELARERHAAVDGANFAFVHYRRRAAAAA